MVNVEGLRDKNFRFSTKVVARAMQTYDNAKISLILDVCAETIIHSQGTHQVA